MTVHAYKHFIRCGTGLRTLMDFYIYVSRKENTLHWEYIDTAIRSLGISEFEQGCRALSRRLFGAASLCIEDLTEAEQEMLAYFAYCGAYGTKQIYIRNKLAEIQGNREPVRTSTKLRYLLRRVFPGRAFFRCAYPFLYRNPWLIPSFWGYRLIRALFRRFDSVRTEMKTLKETTERE